jgi:ABC-2 type transport system ATP-binding protein
MTDDAIVVARGLRKRYGDTEALRGLDLRVPAGTVTGLLGVNGAGKTTAVKILTTLTRPDAGEATIAGYDVVRAPEQVRRRIGLTGQHAAVDDKLTGRENLAIFGRLYRLGGRAARTRADELLAELDLADAADRVVSGWSGGMRRRLDLAASLIVRPPVLFLDEPTTGLDPRSRNAIWARVTDLVAAGTTVLLTTQYLEEADRLADRVVVLAAGRALAEDTPEALKHGLGSTVEVVAAAASALPAAARVLARLTGAEPDVEPDTLRLTARAGAPLGLPAVVRELDAAGVPVVDASVRKPTLDDVFLHLTAAEGSLA